MPYTDKEIKHRLSRAQWYRSSHQPGKAAAEYENILRENRDDLRTLIAYCHLVLGYNNNERAFELYEKIARIQIKGEEITKSLNDKADVLRGRIIRIHNRIKAKEDMTIELVAS